MIRERPRKLHLQAKQGRRAAQPAQESGKSNQLPWHEHKPGKEGTGAVLWCRRSWVTKHRMLQNNPWLKSSQGMRVWEREDDGENGISNVRHCSEEAGGNMFSMVWTEHGERNLFFLGFAKKPCRKVQEKDESDFPSAQELKCSNIWNYRARSSFLYVIPTHSLYWCSQFPPLKWTLIPQAQDEAHLFSPKCSFLKAFHIAWRKALYPKIHHRDGRVAISHALLKQEWLLSLIRRKNEFICFESINVLNLAGKTPWTYLLSAKQQIIWTWTCSHVRGRCSGRKCTFGKNQGH